MKIFILILILSKFALAQFSIEKSSEIFFPVQARDLLSAQQNFPVFWWNFAVIENASQKWDLIANYCREMKKISTIDRAECDIDLGNYVETVRDWARDLPLREPKWQDNVIRKRLDESFAQASVMMGDSTLTTLIFGDPLQTWRDLKSKAEKRIKVPFPREKGVFYDKDTDRAVIPLMFNIPPSKTHHMEAFAEKFPETKVIGPHNSFFENEYVVLKDVKVISAIGSVILLAFAAFLYFSNRARAIFLIPPVLLAIYLASLITSILFNGTIHGLTLAFGSGIVGLTLDYGLHGALNSESKNTWISNTIGFLTTTAGLVVLGMSSIPLLQQMAIFSILGLTFGIVFSYFLLRAFREKLVIQPFNFDPKARKLTTLWLGLLVAAALFGSFRLTPSLNLQRFNFESEDSKRIAKWVREKMELSPPLMRFHNPESVLNEAERELSWAEENQILVENTARYIPSQEVQKSNASTWKGCLINSAQQSAGHTIFTDYFKGVCSEHSPVDPVKLVPKYLSHLHGNGSFLSLWLSKNPEQEAVVKAKYPDARSLSEILLTLPETLQSELRWMVPMALILVSLIIVGYYRTFSSLFFAVLPFFAGLGMVYSVTLALQRDITFITVIGLVMVFGFSIDYGIFMTDIYRDNKERESSTNVVTALSFAALLNLVGFAPLLFANHPVLKDLGVALFFGTLGSYLGSVWGIPAVMQSLALREKRI